MDHRQGAVAEVPVAFGKCHRHRVRIERQTKDPRLIQKPPDIPAAPLAAHEPFEIRFLILAGEPVPDNLVGLGPFLPAEIGWIVFAHSAVISADRTNTGTERTGVLSGLEALRQI